jgi:hypothetical protein
MSSVTESAPTVKIVSPPNKRTVRGKFNLRLQYEGDVKDKEVFIYVNGDLFRSFAAAEKIELDNLPPGKIELTAALMTEDGLVTSDPVSLHYIFVCRPNPDQEVTKEENKSQECFVSVESDEDLDFESKTYDLKEFNEIEEDCEKSEQWKYYHSGDMGEFSEIKKEEQSARSGWGDEPTERLTGCGCGGKKGPHKLTGCGCGGKKGPHHLTCSKKENNTQVQIAHGGAAISRTTTDLVIAKLVKDDDKFLLPIYEDKYDHSLNIINYSDISANLMAGGNDKIYMGRNGSLHYVNAGSSQKLVYKGGVWYPN